MSNLENNYNFGNAGGNTAGTSTSAPNPTPADPQLGGGSGSHFSAEQTTQLAQAEVDAGRLSRERADAMLKAEGFGPLPPPGAPLTAGEAEFQQWCPPAKATDYEMPPILGPDESITPSAIEADRQARNWLVTAKFPREIGSFIAQEIDKTAKQYSRMNDAQRETWARTQHAILERVWGKQTAQKLSMGVQLVVELEEKAPGVTQMLKQTGAKYNAMVISQLAMHAERLMARLR